MCWKYNKYIIFWSKNSSSSRTNVKNKDKRFLVWDFVLYVLLELRDAQKIKKRFKYDLFAIKKYVCKIFFYHHPFIFFLSQFLCCVCVFIISEFSSFYLFCALRSLFIKHHDVTKAHISKTFVSNLSSNVSSGMTDHRGFPTREG